MNLSQLYYFKRLAELQHYTKAAQELNITQPSLSGAIHSLEDELGVDLFKKKGRNIILTESGEEFYKYVSAALRELDKGKDIMQERANKLRGKIELGSVSSILVDFLPKVINEFRTQAGQYVQVRAHTEQTGHILENVQSGKWDLGFCSFDRDHPDLEFIPILNQPLVVACPENHPLAAVDSICLDDLKDYHALSYHLDMPIGRDVHNLLAGRDIDVEYNSSSEEALIGAMRIYDRVAIILKAPFVVNSPGFHLIKLRDVSDDFHIVQMVYNKKVQKTHVVDSFIEFLSSNYRYSS